MKINAWLRLVGTSSHNLHSIFITQKLSQVQLDVASSRGTAQLARAERRRLPGEDSGQRGALLSGMHHPRGAVSCGAHPQQVKGLRGDRVGWCRGEGCDLAQPGSWHEPIHAEDGPLKHGHGKNTAPQNANSSGLEAQDHCGGGDTGRRQQLRRGGTSRTSQNPPGPPT